LVVSPWVAQRSVASSLYDHTSIIKTILKRFCPAELDDRSGIEALVHWLEEGQPHYMGKRVAAAADLGSLLDQRQPRPAPDRSALVRWVADRHRARTTRLLEDPHGMVHPAEAHAMTDLQQRMLAVDQAARDQGHPAGQP
jgi:hypothetical protein